MSIQPRKYNFIKFYRQSSGEIVEILSPFLLYNKFAIIKKQSSNKHT